MALKDSLNIGEDAVYLMDSSAFIFKGYYGNMKMTRTDGFPTGAIYSLARTLLKILKDEQPKFFAFVRDSGKENFRKEIYPLYKANRQDTPEDLISQFAPIEELAHLLGLHVQNSDNCEADDCIASFANLYRQENNIVIVGVDKDLKQCLHPRVIMWDPSSKDKEGGKNGKIITLESFKESSGLEPEQWADIQAIIGDSSDNIPGVKGIGEKTAQKIFKDFPSLEAIKENFENLPPTIKTKFADSLEAMFMYRELTRLDIKSCANVKKEELLRKKVNFDACMSFFSIYQMPSLQKEFENLVKKGIIEVEENSNIQNNSQKNMPLMQEEVKKSKNSLNAHQEQLSLFAPVSEQEKFQDIEIVEILPAISSNNKEIALIPVQSIERNKEGFYLAFENSSFLYTGEQEKLYNFIKKFETFICFDLKNLLHDFPKIFYKDDERNLDSLEIFDLSLMSYLLNPEQRDYSWAKIFNILRNEERESFKDISSHEYAKTALVMKNILLNHMNEQNILELYKNLELPLLFILESMENKGISLDSTTTESFLNEVQKDLERSTQNIYTLAGKEFNIRSAQQMGDILFNTLDLPTVGKTKGGQSSTSQEALEKLIDKHPIIEAILEYRKLEKLRSTYLEPLPKLATEKGRIHTHFNQMATATGRLSSSNPNLQNIPIRGDLGKRLRACFVAEENNLLISADYSQIELRVLAQYSQEPTLLNAFKNDEDIHKSTAALLNSVDLKDVTTEQRQAAKTINFGLLYGMGARKLAQDIKVSLKEAQAFIENYFNKLQGINSFYEQTLINARKLGYVVTIADRRRFLFNLNSSNERDKALAERQAINTLIQGSAADIIKLAMIAVYNDKELQELKAELLLQVHDELILSVPEENAEQAGKRVAYLMSSVKPNSQNHFDVPLKVEFANAKNWLLAH